MDAVDGLTLEGDLEAGRRQWTVAWRRFARQWTQPQLLKLADSVLGGRYLHSSQISGFATGKLREPSPKVFVAVGRLNQAIANGELGEVHKDLWVEKEFLADKDGNPLDAVGCFRAFTGELDLGLGDIRLIPEDQLEDANKRLGRFVRTKLSSIGIDFIEDLPALTGKDEALVKSVLLGKRLDANELAEAIPALLKILNECGSEIESHELWHIALIG
jgi:hypothetical protein